MEEGSRVRVVGGVELGEGVRGGGRREEGGGGGGVSRASVVAVPKQCHLDRREVARTAPLEQSPIDVIVAPHLASPTHKDTKTHIHTLTLCQGGLIVTVTDARPWS